MAFSLANPIWKEIDEKRRQSALSGDMTPLAIDLEAGNASFAGSTDTYFANLDECSCLDFHINLLCAAPCKHMIRLAMELCFLPSEGKVDDIQAAKYRLALCDATKLIKTGDIASSGYFALGLKRLYKQNKIPVTLYGSLAEYPATLFYSLSKDGKNRVADNTYKKEALSLVKAFETRIGEWILSDDEMIDAVMNLRK